MWKPMVILVLCLYSFTYAVPLGLKKNMAIMQEEEEPMLMLATDEETRPEVMISRLNLPSNATSIRADITDGFSCDNKTYGYYADVENECQIFHVCLPVTYADGKENTFRWSFICPEETVFSQDSFTCMRPEDMSIDCEESFKYYELNRNFGVIESEDSPSSADEDMDMEEMSRQPLGQDFGEDNKPTIVAAPVKKQTVKVQNSNRRKTQTNRVTIESQRKKVQPMRKSPQPLAPATTAKPLEEDVPMLEQEVERTTVKYQRFTKRPGTVIKDQVKPEPSKPEQQFVRQELFTQKRKRPQTFSATRIDAAVQTESESKPEASEKTDTIVPPQSEPISRDQAEAQASEIAEISIKPQMEKIAELKPIESEKTASLAISEKEPVLVEIPIDMDEPSDVKSEISSLPENTPSRVEVVEIPIQKIDEPMMSVPDAMEPMKAEEEKLLNEEIIAEEAMQAELTRILEKLAEQEAEKTALETPTKPEKPMEAEPVPEPEKVLEDPEPEKLLDTAKAADVPSEPEVVASEPVKVLETVQEPEVPKMPEAESEMLSKKETLMIESEMPSKAEATLPEPEMPLKNKAPEPQVSAIIESPAAKPEPTKVEMPLRIEVPALTPASELKKPIEAEIPAAEPEAAAKIDIPIAEPEMPLEIELPVAVSKPDLPVVQASVAELEMPLNVDELAVESESEKPVEVVVPTIDQAVIPPAAVKIPIELAEKPIMAELPLEPMSELNPKPIQAEVELENSSEAVQSAEQIAAQPQPSAVETEDAQSLILDFISSLVNSENSNMEEQSGTQNELKSEGMLEPIVSETEIVEERPAEVEPIQEQLNTPVMQDTDQMYQIPVQIIETPEPETPIPVPVVAEQKQPLSIDDVVELVKESLDNPAEKENLVQQPLDDQPMPQPGSDEVKPIYHRYFEFDSNLLKSEALTASDENVPAAVSATNQEVQEEAQKTTNTMEMPSMPELSKTNEKPSKPVQLASEPEPVINSLPQALPAEPASAISPADPLAMSRSANRFKMDPRKRRFLFRSDAS